MTPALAAARACHHGRRGAPACDRWRRAAAAMAARRSGSAKFCVCPMGLVRAPNSHAVDPCDAVAVLCLCQLRSPCCGVCSGGQSRSPLGGP
eukprot:15219350-Alexandrium_andersonii.AAC.1